MRWSALTVLFLAGCTGDDALRAYCNHYHLRCSDGLPLDAGATGGGDGGGGGSMGGGGGGAPMGGGGGGAPMGGGGAAMGGGGGAPMGGGTSTGGGSAVDAGGPANGGWKSVNTGLEGALVAQFAIDPTDAEHVLAATNVGLFERRGSGVWSAVDAVGTTPLFGVAFSADGALAYAVGAQPSPTAYTGSWDLVFYEKNNAAPWSKSVFSSAFPAGPPSAMAVDASGTVLVVARAEPNMHTVDTVFECIQTTAAQAGCTGVPLIPQMFSPEALDVSTWEEPNAGSQTLVLTRDGLFFRNRFGVTRVATNWGSQLYGSFARNPDGGAPFVHIETPTTANVFEAQHVDGGLFTFVDQGALPNPGSFSHFVVTPSGTVYATGFVVAGATNFVWRGSLGSGAWTALAALPTHDTWNGTVGALAWDEMNQRLWVGASSFFLAAQGTPTWAQGPWSWDAIQQVWSTQDRGLFANTPVSVALDPADASHVWVTLRSLRGATPTDRVFESQGDGGWSVITTPTVAFNTPTSIAIDPFDGQHRVLLGGVNATFKETFDGLDWLDGGTTSALWSVSFDDATPGARVLGLANSVQVVAADGGALGQSSAINGTFFPRVAFPRDGGLPGDALVAGNGKLVWFKDGGVNAVVSTGRSCVAVAAINPDDAWCANVNGVLEHTAPTWTSEPGISGVKSLALDENDPSQVWAGTDAGVAVRINGTWESRNRGLPVAPVMSVTPSRAQPSTLYLGVWGRGLWRTDTFGR